MSGFKGTKLAADKVIKIGSRLEFYPEEAPEGVSSRVEEIKNGKILAAMPMNEKGVPIIPRPGEAMMGKTPGDGCFYKFSTHYLDKAREENIPVWIVTMPAEVQKIQNREFVRVSADYTVILRPLNEYGAMGDMIITRITDISGGGIALTNDKELPVGSKAVVELTSIPGVGMLRITGQIMRCVPIKNATTPTYQIGVKFLDMSKVHQNKLVKFIFEIQRQSLAKGIGTK